MAPPASASRLFSREKRDVLLVGMWGMSETKNFFECQTSVSEKKK